MRTLKSTAAVSLVAGVAMTLTAQAVSADETQVTCTRTRSCTVIAKKPGERVHPKPNVDQKPDRRDAASDRVQGALKKFSAALADYDRQLARYNRCILTFDPSSNPAGCGSMPTAPNAPQFGTEAFNRPGNPAITAGQAAAIAVARLQLPTVAPGIGPSPELNPWKIAAVGYPLWLWADGPTHIGPVSDSVAGLSVSLDAKVSSLTFRMGDGHSVTCSGSGHRWTTAVEPGTKSPSCGYSYAKPSLPDRNYTVAAITNWAVTWTSNGQSGLINVPAVETTELPVGELQVLVR
jgi:hypothetical protein